MEPDLDQIMERASRALMRTDYFTCEALCVEALAQAHRWRAWPYYARILLPLQEARRQRRLVAVAGTLRLGTAGLDGSPVSWLEQFQSGAIVLTHPHGVEDARALLAQARRQRRYVEVLLADSDVQDDRWTLVAFGGPQVRREVPAPPRAWRDRWLTPGERPDPGPDAKNLQAGASPADWFIDATELLGDEAIAQVTAPLGTIQRIEQLEQMLEVTNHEKLHQRLGEAARAMPAAA